MQAMGIVTALGHGVEHTWPRLVAGDQSAFTRRADLVPRRTLLVGEAPLPLPPLPEKLRRFECRNNRLSLAAVTQIERTIRAVIDRVGAERVAVVMGSSTSGVAAAEHAIAERARTGLLPETFDYVQYEHGGVAEFLARYLDVSGPAYTLSTACSSGAKAVASARSLLALGFCDAVVTGGVDSLCRLTANGFSALAAVADDVCNPFSLNRRGLTLGEGAAVFLMTQDSGGIQVVGVGEAGDAHHISAPDPDGAGAEAAMRQALADAGALPESIAYLNLHGTGTPLNDAMESQAVHRVFAGSLPCSSTKPLVGHTLGACGAIELAFCWMMLSHCRDGLLPLLPHCWDRMEDPALPRLRFARAGERVSLDGRALVMSNSFGFGGNNCSLVLGLDPP
jgi:3-oxoacyl-[acyl-carrier-protein] synthase-1